ncbi:Ig-like domain-containing protein, partial [Clostridium perfringens]
MAKDSWGSAYWGLSEVMFTDGENRKIQSLEPESVSTVIERAPELPSKVTAILEDGNKRNVRVDWDAVDDSMYEKENEFIVYGSVYGSDIKAECKVIVEKCIQPKNKVTDVNITEQGGNATLTWKDPKNVDFEKIIVKYQNLKEIKTIEIDKNIQKLALSD